MESGAGGLVSSSEKEGASYTYWVRKITEDAAPLPLPRKLNPEDLPPSQSQSSTLASAWNRAGTWEEKSLSNWATPRIKELLFSLGSIQFSFGRAEVEDVTKCVGDAFMVIVRNKKRVGYTYELTLKVKGEWIIQGEKKFIGGHIDVPEFSFGELDDLQKIEKGHMLFGIVHEYLLPLVIGFGGVGSLILGMDSVLVALLLTRKVVEVRLSEARDILHQDKTQMRNDLKLFLQPVREKLLQFEQELRDR
ncbi:hypothetical protein JHK86_023566 [Glycine max]|nr:hypothetical protein JHK86_023566 [Glycine max]